MCFAVVPIISKRYSLVLAEMKGVAGDYAHLTPVRSAGWLEYMIPQRP